LQLNRLLIQHPGARLGAGRRYRVVTRAVEPVIFHVWAHAELHVLGTKGVGGWIEIFGALGIEDPPHQEAEK